MKKKNLKLGTRIIKACNEADFSRVRSHIPPIFQTVNYDYKDSDEGFAIFKGDQKGYLYSRHGNPTTDLLANLVALLESGESGVAAASGMAVISALMSAVLGPGDEIVSSKNIYGGTRSFLLDFMHKFGVETHFVDITNLTQVEDKITSKTKMLYTEALGNPNLVIADIAALATMARKRDLLFCVDSTFTPPPVLQPLKLGADVVLHSATKYIGGHGDLLGGVLVGEKTIVEQAAHALKLFGGTLSPFNAWLAIRGLKTLNLRVERQCKNARQLAGFLQEQKNVTRVLYPGLDSHPQYDLAQKQFLSFASMLTFEVKGGEKAARTVLDNVRVCNFTTSLGEIDTLIIHPASTSHVDLSAEERAAIGITDGLLRLSVGIEEIDDLLDDLAEALKHV
jgi:methionine-gamma-lyase